MLPSSPLVPADDPTLLFTNAGMVQFKDYFIGAAKAPFKRATTAQKCLRAGGKHNDLEQVGKTPLHHTFFEMLGNFSFADYHKEEAIRLAWRFITEELGLKKEGLYATVHHTDDESAAVWRKLGVKEVKKRGDEDNFWSMDELGPCGPCSEIFYRRGKFDGEIWNLVFMERAGLGGGKTEPLAARGVDTGMGLERIAAVCEGVFDNYQTSIFAPLIARIAEELDCKPSQTAARVMADHLRASAFLIAEGVLPGNEGRAYVLRRIIRRAVRHGWQRGMKKPLLAEMVEPLVRLLGGQWQELESSRSTIEITLKGEEERFLATINKGMELLEAKMPKSGRLRGDVAFMLYDTYGFPLDLTTDILAERGIGVDEAEFARLMAEQKQRGRKAWQGNKDSGQGELTRLTSEIPPTDFVGYERPELNGEVVALFDEEYKPLQQAGSKPFLLVTRATPFYAAGGGQQSDRGRADDHEVVEVFKNKNGVFFHRINPKDSSPRLRVGGRVKLVIDRLRRLGLRRHHSATHLLHAALRQTLGEHVAQKGSSVEADRLRFDVSHPGPVTGEQIAEAERLVVSQICEDREVITEITDKQTAVKSGAIALFGETYGKKVRVVKMGKNGVKNEVKNFSVELCGGTHVARLGELGGFAVVAESAVGAGIRRLEAVCGEAAMAHWQRLRFNLENSAKLLKVAPDRLETRLRSLLDGRKKANPDRATPIIDGAHRKKLGSAQFAWLSADGAAMPQLKAAVDALRAENQVAAAFAVNEDEGKVSFALGSDPKLIDSVKLAKAVAEAVQGSGGGRANLSAGGGTKPEGMPEALAQIEEMVKAVAKK